MFIVAANKVRRLPRISHAIVPPHLRVPAVEVHIRDDAEDSEYTDTVGTLTTSHCMSYGGFVNWRAWLKEMSMSYMRVQTHTRSRFLSHMPAEAFFPKENALDDVEGAVKVGFPLAHTLSILKDPLRVWADDAALAAKDMLEFFPLVAAMSGLPVVSAKNLNHHHMHLLLQEHRNLCHAGLKGVDTKQYAAPWLPGEEVPSDRHMFTFHIDMMLAFRHASDEGVVSFS
jgi:hypothetical protein